MGNLSWKDGGTLPTNLHRTYKSKGEPYFRGTDRNSHTDRYPGTFTDKAQIVLKLCQKWSTWRNKDKRRSGKENP